MERVIELLLDLFVKEVIGEGERRFKLLAFEACISAVEGIRRLFILAFALCFGCFLSALSFFHLAFLLSDQWQSGGVEWGNPKLWLSGAVFALSTGAAAFFARKARWVNAFGLRQKIRELELKIESSRAGELSEERIVALIEKVIERRSQTAQEPPPPAA